MSGTSKFDEISPKVYARIGGVFYLFIIAAGIFGELLVRDKLVVSGDPSATANNIIASPLLWRIGILGDLLMHVCDIPLMLIFYILFRRANKNLALLLVFFNLVVTSVLVATKLKLFETLFLLGNSEYLSAFDPKQLHVLAYLAIRADGYGFGFGLLFFGFECIILGYLIFRSGFLPKAIGMLMLIAGICYLINSFALILSPTIANILFPAILFPCFIGELSFCLWLIIKGVNIAKWEAEV